MSQADHRCREGRRNMQIGIITRVFLTELGTLDFAKVLVKIVGGLDDGAQRAFYDDPDLVEYWQNIADNRDEIIIIDNPDGSVTIQE